MATITKLGLSAKLRDKVPMTHEMSLDVINAVVASMSECVCSGHNIVLSNFGGFKVKQAKAKPGMDFTTGERIVIPAKRVVKFNSAPELKRKMND